MDRIERIAAIRNLKARYFRLMETLTRLRLDITFPNDSGPEGHQGA